MSTTKRYDLKSQLLQIACGATTSIVTRFILQPFEVLKIRFQLQVEPLDSHQKSKYRSLYQSLRVIYHEEGLRGLWRGHNVGQLMSLSYGTAQWWAYEQIFLAFTDVSYTKDHPNVNRFISGGLSGAIATMVSMPFDVVRTRLISQDHVRKGYANATAGMPKLLKEEGIYGLYRGLGPSLVQIGPLVGTNYLLYGMSNDMGLKVWNIENVKDLPTWFLLINGATSGMIAKALVYPTDILKRRLQIQGFQKHRTSFGENIVCKGMIDCALNTYRNEGMRGFYKGMSPTLIKAAVSTAFYFAVYEKMKMLLFE